MFFQSNFEIFFKFTSEDSTERDDRPSVYTDTDCILTLDISDGEIPILFCQIVQDGNVLTHPALNQRRPIPPMERDPDLEMCVPVGSVTDPNQPIDSSHILAPLFQRASMNEETVTVSFLVFLDHRLYLLTHNIVHHR